MKAALLCAISLLIVVGCTSGNSDDGTAKLPNGAGTPLNPTGKVTAEQKTKEDQISSDALKADKARGRALLDAREGGK